MLWSLKKINAQLLERDEGLTLTEFVLVTFFFLFVIILVFQMLFFAQTNAKQANRFAAMTNEVGMPLDIMERYFSQNTKIISMGSQTVYMSVAQKDGSGAPIGTYNVTITANENGTLTFKRSALGSETFTLSSANLNVGTSTPLFTFYTLENVVTTDPTKAAAVKINIVASVPDSSNTVNSQRTVMFRNGQ